MFKKPFNRKVGEQRECKQCNESFFTFKPIWRCQKCTNKLQRVIEEKKRALYQKKDSYPFDNRTNEAGARFHRIQRELRKAWIEFEKTGDKSIITEHYDKQLKEIEENGIMTWILDRRSDDAKKEMNPNTKSRNTIKIDYPDTRGHYEE